MPKKSEEKRKYFNIPSVFVGIEVVSAPRCFGSSKIRDIWKWKKDHDGTMMEIRMDEFARSWIGLNLIAYCPIFPPGIVGYVEEEIFNTLFLEKKPIQVHLPNKSALVSEEDYLLLPPELKRPTILISSEVAIDILMEKNLPAAEFYRQFFCWYENPEDPYPEEYRQLYSKESERVGFYHDFYQRLVHDDGPPYTSGYDFARQRPPRVKSPYMVFGREEIKVTNKPFLIVDEDNPGPFLHQLKKNFQELGYGSYLKGEKDLEKKIVALAEVLLRDWLGAHAPSNLPHLKEALPISC